MDSLATKSNCRAVHNAVDHLPIGVDATYDEALKRITEQGELDRGQAKQVLAWVVHACRPLHLRELQYALAVSPGMTAMDSENIMNAQILTSTCAGLVVIAENSSIVHLVRK